MQQINFSALPKSRSTNNFQKRKIPSLFKIIFLFFGVMASVFVVLAGAVVLLPLFWVAIGFMIIVGYRSTSTTRSNYSKFAADNNWVEWGKVPPQPIMESIGYLFISTYLSGLLDERKF